MIILYDFSKFVLMMKTRAEYMPLPPISLIFLPGFQNNYLQESHNRPVVKKRENQAKQDNTEIINFNLSRNHTTLHQND